MSKNYIIIISILLSACGGGNSSAVTEEVFVPLNCTVNDSTFETVRVNSIDITVFKVSGSSIIEGIPVQIDHNGNCVLTDVNGVATFNNLTVGQHDIHVFGMSSYDWKSFYNLTITEGSQLYKSAYLYTKRKINNLRSTNVSNTINSHALIQGTIENQGPSSNVSMYHYTNNFPNTHDYYISPSETDYKFKFSYEDAPGTIIKNDLWAIETETKYTATSSREITIIDIVHVPEFMLPTSSEKNVPNSIDSTQNIIFNPIGSKPMQSELIQFGAVSYPVGMSFSSISISSVLNHLYYFDPIGVRVYSNIGDQLPLNTPLSAYIAPFNSPEISVRLSASSKVNGFTTWHYDFYSPVGTTGVIITPKMTAPPRLTSQRGSTISWDLVGFPAESLDIFIRDDITRSYWDIEIKGAINQVILPELPAGLKPILNVGTEYEIDFRGYYGYRETPQSATSIFEQFSHIALWTR